MKRVVLLLAAVCLAVPATCLADEMSDAEAAIAEAEALVEELNSMGLWIGPALAMKMKAEEYMKMAKESFDAGEYADALMYAEKAMEYAEIAKGLRLWYLLTRSGVYGYTATPTPS
jgi:hypothetical protein